MGRPITAETGALRVVMSDWFAGVHRPKSQGIFESHPGAVDKAAELGFDGVVVSLGIAPDSGLLLASPAVQQEYRSRLLSARNRPATAGIGIPVVCLDALDVQNPVAASGDERSLAEANMQQSLVVAASMADLGTDTVRWPFFGSEITDGNKEQVADVIGRVAEWGKDMGVTVEIETSAPTALAIDVANRINLPQVGIAFDTGNAYKGGEDPEQALAAVDRAGHLMTIDIKDNSIPGDPEPILAPRFLDDPDRRIDFTSFMRALPHVSGNGVLLMETLIPGFYRQDVPNTPQSQGFIDRGQRRNLRYLRKKIAAAQMA